MKSITIGFSEDKGALKSIWDFANVHAATSIKIIGNWMYARVTGTETYDEKFGSKSQRLEQEKNEVNYAVSIARKTGIRVTGLDCENDATICKNSISDAYKAKGLAVPTDLDTMARYMMKAKDSEVYKAIKIGDGKVNFNLERFLL